MEKFKARQRLVILVIYTKVNGKKESLMVQGNPNGKMIKKKKKLNTQDSIGMGKKMDSGSIEKKKESHLKETGQMAI